jgi:hypothetical protein
MRLAISDGYRRYFILYIDTPLHCLKDVHGLKGISALLVLLEHIANLALLIASLK